MGKLQAVIIGGASLFLALVLVVFFAEKPGKRPGGAPAPSPEPAVGGGGGAVQTPVGIPIGAVAPGFELPRDDGTRLKLETFRGRVVLVNFWATWCPPCAEETPSLEALHARFEAKGLTVLGVSVDDGWEPVRRFRETYRMTFPLVLDPDEEVSHRYGTFKYPESYLIDREGRVVKRYVGAVNWMRAEVTAEIASSLGSGS